MKLKRYYTSENLAACSTCILEGDEFHHLANVMRTKVGDKVELFNGSNKNYLATVVSLGKKQAELMVESEQINSSEPRIKLDVFQALAKGDKLSLITQKITELGASGLYVFTSEFCDVKTNTGKLDKLQTVCINACKQCGRSSVVNVQGILTIKEVCKTIESYDKFFVFYEAEEKDSLKNHVLNLVSSNAKNIGIMIGAEGGFSASEIAELKNAGAIIVSLGKRILRTETASIIGTAVIMQMLE